MNHIALTREELDICILSKISVCINLDVQARQRKEEKERKFTKSAYLLHHHDICGEFFKHIHNIGQYKLNSLNVHYKLNDIEPRTHKSKKRCLSMPFPFRT